MSHNQFIRCIENIEDLSGQEKYEYGLLVGGCAVSRKTICYNKKTKKFVVENHIDDTTEKLTKKQMVARFKEAMDKRCLIAEIN